MERFSRTMLFFVLAFSVAVFSALGAVVLWSKISPATPVQERTLPISTEGRVFAKPDVGAVVLTVITEGNDPKAVEDENARKINAVIEFLKDEGVKDEDIKTSSYSLQPKYSYEQPVILSEREKPQPGPVSVIVGYTVYQSVTVKIRNFENAGVIIAGAVDRGVNQVSSLSFSIDDIDAYKKEARELAFNKAKDQAEDLARLGGFKIKGVVSIQEGYYYPRPLYMEGAVALGVPETGSSTPPQIKPGSQEVVITLTVVFKIE